jgi:hypothetical protein
MRFQVPINKDTGFAQDLFSLISEQVSDLASEHEKLPSKIIFMGQIGKEVHSFIKEKEWNFKGFELEEMGGSLSAIVFKYSSPLTQIEDSYGVQFEEGSLHNKEIKGIPGPDTIGKIMGAYSAPLFRKERTIRPEKRILLTR